MGLPVRPRRRSSPRRNAWPRPCGPQHRRSAVASKANRNATAAAGEARVAKVTALAAVLAVAAVQVAVAAVQVAAPPAAVPQGVVARSSTPSGCAPALSCLHSVCWIAECGCAKGRVGPWNEAVAEATACGDAC